MLFDLRGRGRRRTVQVIYIGLAVIFMLGFVGLGVGGGFGSSGIFSAFTGEKGSGGTSYSTFVSTYDDGSNPAHYQQQVVASLAIP